MEDIVGVYSNKNMQRKVHLHDNRPHVSRSGLPKLFQNDLGWLWPSHCVSIERYRSG